MKDLKARLPHDKIKINWNENPIEMSKFLSFLTIDVVQCKDFLGYSNGWTRRENKDCNLFIRGGHVNSKEWLDDLEYGVKLANPYNNYVNPFYLFDIMTNEGRAFFIEYYKEDIEKIQTELTDKVTQCGNSLQEAKGMKIQIGYELQALKDDAGLIII